MRLTIFTGPRGVGKTVMLNAIASQTQLDHQWLVIHETATPGFLDRLNRSFAQELHTRSSRRGITGVTLPAYLGGGSVSISPPVFEKSDNLRDTIAPLLDQCEAHGTGILITLDEVHADNTDELRRFATAVQHLVREKRQFAVAFAGLPRAVDELLTDSQITFLRRADRRDLRDVALDDVAQALKTTIDDNGRGISPEALQLAARSTGGYPFMIQLVGYHIWRQADGNTITEDAVHRGVDQARARLGSLVHAPALRDLSEVDRTYLIAMAQDEPGQPSTSAEIAKRMGRNTQYASVYRARLIAAGMIEPAGYGRVQFAIPYLRDYLIEHAAHQEMAKRNRRRQ